MITSKAFKARTGSSEEQIKWIQQSIAWFESTDKDNAFVNAWPDKPNQPIKRRVLRTFAPLSESQKASLQATVNQHLNQLSDDFPDLNGYCFGEIRSYLTDCIEWTETIHLVKNSTYPQILEHLRSKDRFTKYLPHLAIAS